MTDPSDPDDTKVYFDESATALGSALGPDNGSVLQRQRALLSSNCQLYEILLGDDERTVLRTVRILRGDGIPRVQVEPGVAIVLQHGMSILGRDGRSYQNDPDVRREITYFQVFAWMCLLFWYIFHPLFQPKHVLVVLGHDYEVFPPSPDVNYNVA